MNHKSASDYPLVILDWVMPGLDGPELVRRIRSHARPGYVFTVLLAASNDHGEFIQGLAAGADDFMVKPLDREELRVRLRSGERVLKLEQTLVEQNRMLAERNPARLLVFCDEDAEARDPIAALAAARGAGPEPIPLAVLIGPEGGFAQAERAALLELPNAVRLALGPRILRADTAAVAALALVGAVLGDWR